MESMRAFCVVCLAVAAALSYSLIAGASAADSIVPPPDYHVEEGIWIKEHGQPASAWGQYTGATNSLTLSSSVATVDIAYVIRSEHPSLRVTATLILYRNSDARVRFLDNGTLLLRAAAKGCSAARGEAGEPVGRFWTGGLIKDGGEYYQGNTYYLFLTTFDPGGHSGLYQLRVNVTAVTGLTGGSSWEKPNGNPRVPWIFFRVPSGAQTSVSASEPGQVLRAAAMSTISGSGFPANGSTPCPYEIFIDCVSWLNGSCYGGQFLRHGIQIPRTLVPGLHTLRTVCAETESSFPFRTYQWEAKLKVSPNGTVPGGRSVNITGQGFPPSEWYSIYWGRINANSTPILSGAVTSFGNFSASFQFPKNASLGVQNLTAITSRVSGPPSASAKVLLDPWPVRLIVRPSSAHQGDWLDINGSDYPAGCRYRISVGDVTIAEGTADQKGAFYYRAYTLDPLFNPGPHVIWGNATDYGRSACGRVELRVMQYDAAITVRPGSTHPGTSVAIDGQGFPRNSFVNIQLDGAMLGESLVTSSDGSFHFDYDVPKNFSLGRHVVRAYAPWYGGPPSANSTLDLVQWPVQTTVDAAAPHPGGWVKITGRGFPLNAAYEIHLNRSMLVRAMTSPTGGLDQSPSLPLNITLGAYLLEILAPDYSGPPKSTFRIQITDWSASIQLLPANPRPGEALQILGKGYPRNCPYTILLDEGFVGNGTTLADGTFAPYIFLRSNLSIGTHWVNVTATFPEFRPTVVEFSAEPWRLSLSTSPRSGVKGTTLNIQADGCPPRSEATVYWDGQEASRGYCSFTGSYVDSLALNYPTDDAYHRITVRCDGDYAGPPCVHAYFWLGGMAPTITISARDEQGSARSSFFANETAYASGTGLPRSIDVWLYLLNGSGPTRQQGPLSVRTDSTGSFTIEVVHRAPLWGSFGLWLDINCNGLLDANDVLSQPAFTSRPRPQLAMARVDASRSSATQGEVVTLRLAVVNRGLEPQDAHIHVTRGSLEIATALVRLLPANSSETVVVDWDTTYASPGSAPLKARVDAPPGETATADNEMEFGPVTIHPAPDITVLSLTPYQRRARTGSVVRFDAAVRNSGMGNQTFTIQLVWGDEVIISRSLSLPAGATVMEKLEWSSAGVKPDERRIRLRTAPIPFERNPLDNDLASGTITILPPNTLPNPVPGGPYSGISGIPTRFNGSASLDDEGITAYRWDFGDGSSGTGMLVSHTYAAPGWYLVGLTVTDSDGASSSLYTAAQIHKPLDVRVWSSDRSGSPRNEFRFDEGVYATVSSPAVYNASLYVVPQGSEQGGQLLKDASDGPEPLRMAGNATVLVWSAWLPQGRYDIVLDLNVNGRFDPDFDPMHSAFLVVGQNGAWLALILAIVLFARTCRGGMRFPG